MILPSAQKCNPGMKQKWIFVDENKAENGYFSVIFYKIMRTLKINLLAGFADR